jgi:hypothetical protein
MTSMYSLLDNLLTVYDKQLVHNTMYILHSCVDSFLLFRATSCQFYGIYSFPDCHRYRMRYWDTREDSQSPGDKVPVTS